MYEDRREVFLHRVNVDFQCKSLSIDCIALDLRELEFDFHRDIIFVISDNNRDFLISVCDYFVDRDVLNFLRNSNFQFE